MFYGYSGRCFPVRNPYLQASGLFCLCFALQWIDKHASDASYEALFDITLPVERMGKFAVVETVEEEEESSSDDEEDDKKKKKKRPGDPLDYMELPVIPFAMKQWKVVDMARLFKHLTPSVQVTESSATHHPPFVFSEADITVKSVFFGTLTDEISSVGWIATELLPPRFRYESSLRVYPVDYHVMPVGEVLLNMSHKDELSPGLFILLPTAEELRHTTRGKSLHDLIEECLLAAESFRRQHVSIAVITEPKNMPEKSLLQNVNNVMKDINAKWNDGLTIHQERFACLVQRVHYHDSSLSVAAIDFQEMLAPRSGLLDKECVVILCKFQVKGIIKDEIFAGDASQYLDSGSEGKPGSLSLMDWLQANQDATWRTFSLTGPRVACKNLFNDAAAPWQQSCIPAALLQHLITCFSKEGDDIVTFPASDLPVVKAVMYDMPPPSKYVRKQRALFPRHLNMFLFPAGSFLFLTLFPCFLQAFQPAARQGFLLLLALAQKASSSPRQV